MLFFRTFFIMALLCAAFAESAHAYPGNAACGIDKNEFDGWFVSKKAAPNGLVTFADSTAFPTKNSACDFYKWSTQMFLWITSPLPNGLVLTSPVFYDVNFDSSGNAIFVPNGKGNSQKSFKLRGTKPQKFQPGGQAGGQDTLLSLNGSLVYFGIHANDVYAWFNTAVVNGNLPYSTPFPTTKADVTPIVSYAQANGASLPDANALTMELKTAWVDATTVANAADHITISATVPNYVGKVGDQKWIIDPKQSTITKRLALVGMHVVGPVRGHPELVWATFEHASNAPNDEYYVSFGGAEVFERVPYNSSGKWTFMTYGGSRSGALEPKMKVATNGTIDATTKSGVVQNNVYRAAPWGNVPQAASANNNGQIISLNRDVAKLLGAADLRGKYFLVGAVWTQNGSIPATATDTAQQTGSKLLANATMETYHQASPSGCFGCHFAQPGTGQSNSTSTSHLFSNTNNPLVPKK
jgi:hypothetical protein